MINFSLMVTIVFWSLKTSVVSVSMFPSVEELQSKYKLKTMEHLLSSLSKSRIIYINFHPQNDSFNSFCSEET
jgi:hypothetical protein